jgi:glycerol uptake facilitator protein
MGDTSPDTAATTAPSATGAPPSRFDELRQGLWGDLMAEFFGVVLLISFGDGVVAMAVAALNQSGRGAKIFDASGDWLLITWGWALAVALAVYATGGITGAHINPAVTLAFAVRGDFPWKKVPGYWVAQVAGGFVGAAIVYLVYHDAISSFEAANHITRGNPGSVTTFSIFATFPAPYFRGGWIGPLIDQIVGTAFLLIFVAALIDRRNLAPKSNMTPLLVGFAVAAIGMSYGANAGYAINPARDLGPRIFAAISGWGSVALPGNGVLFSNYFWIPIVGPLIGGVLGILTYGFFVNKVLISRGVPESD